MLHSARCSTLVLSALAALICLTGATAARPADTYEPNDTANAAADLWLLNGSPANNCLGRGASYYVYPANAELTDVDWYSFELRGEHSLDVGLYVRTDWRIEIKLYREGLSGMPASSPSVTWIVDETSAEPFGYRAFSPDVSSGTNDTWFIKVTPLSVKSEMVKLVNYDFSVMATNRYFNRFASETGWTVPYYSNEDDLRAHPHAGEQVVRTVIVQHGFGRNAHDYFDYVRQAAMADGVDDQVLIIAPNFMTSDDCPRSDESYWTASGWKYGDDSLNPSPIVSSYTVLDEMIESGVGGSWPNVEKVVLAGHSGGGQLAHRYASATTVPEEIAPIPMAFVAANAGSYMWPDELRPLPSSVISQVPDSMNLLDFYTEMRGGSPFVFNADCDGDGLINPSEYSGCPAGTVTFADIDFDGNGSLTSNDASTQTSCTTDYDDYAYGVLGRHDYRYLAGDGDLTIAGNFLPWVNRYTGRELTFLLGTSDTRTYQSSGANQTCKQRLQGKNRLIRGMNYFIHFDAVYPGHNFDITFVPGIGHSGRNMLGSWQGKYRMFYEDGSLTSPSYCGLGFEPALFLPLLAWIRGRRIRARARRLR